MILSLIEDCARQDALLVCHGQGYSNSSKANSHVKIKVYDSSCLSQDKLLTLRKELEYKISKDNFWTDDKFVLG